MAIPKITEQNIQDAIKYIDEHGVPNRNKSTVYELVSSDGKKYPPKYVIAVAAYLATGREIRTDDFNAVEAKSFFSTRGYTIESSQIKYEMIITADGITSTDERFTMNDLGMGDNYKPIDFYYEKANGEIIRRIRDKSENRISNRTLPKLACQIFESELDSLSDNDKLNFPICQYTPQNEIIRGIFPSEAEFRKSRNTIERVKYTRKNGSQFVIYSWNLFSTILFEQECLRRFGDTGDKFVLIYRDKTEQEENNDTNEENIAADIEKTTHESKNPYSRVLLESKNIIFRGAPGTGKSYLAKAIAADIISNGYTDQYSDLTTEQKKQVEFVQFHPSYDYSDFVEGLRPKMNDGDTLGFELRDGVFKAFVDRARQNFEDSQKSKELREQELSTSQIISEFFDNIEFGETEFKTITGNRFTITDMDESHISIFIPDNPTVNKLSISLDELRKMLESGKDFERISDITAFFGKQFATQGYSYDFALYKEIKKLSTPTIETNVDTVELKKYIFIIDEINRGEISKILGELFFSIDPGYRGKAGEVSTQYSNMHINPNDKFYIPENVYIIGTMNDIDRSVG